MFKFCNFVLPTCRRPDITEGLKSLKCRTLIFVGDSSPFHSEALHMTSKLDRRFSALVEVCSTKYYLGILVWCNINNSWDFFTDWSVFCKLSMISFTAGNLICNFFFVQNIPEFHIIHNIQIQCLALHLK